MTWSAVATIDYHTEGEPFRIVPAPPINFPGRSVSERRDLAEASDEANELRTFLALEPRGFDGMYGGFIVPPDDSGAHFGALFWHGDGFSKACGHGSIALTTWAVETGIVSPDTGGTANVIIDVPAGRIRLVARIRDGKPLGVVYRGLPTRVVELGRAVQTRHGPVRIDTVEAGHHLFAVNLGQTSLHVTRTDLPSLISLYHGLRHQCEHEHWPGSRIGIAVFYQPVAVKGNEILQRGVAIYGNGQVDRSPCGTGTAGLTALMHFTGQLPFGGRLIQKSILGTSFIGTIAGSDGDTGRVVPLVQGRAYSTGTHEYTRECADPFPRGFTLSEGS